MKESCGSSCEKYKAEWDACTERVSGRSETAETCTQELFDFVHCVDSCVSCKSNNWLDQFFILGQHGQKMDKKL